MTLEEVLDDLCIQHGDDGEEVVGAHEWEEHEARAILDSRSGMLLGMRFTWQCALCGEIRMSETIHPSLPDQAA